MYISDSINVVKEWEYNMNIKKKPLYYKMKLYVGLFIFVYTN